MQQYFQDDFKIGTVINLNRYRLEKNKIKILLNVILLIVFYEVAGVVYNFLFGYLPQCFGFDSLPSSIFILKLWHLALIPVIIIFSKKFEIALLKEIKSYSFKVFIFSLIIGIIIFLFNPILSQPLLYIKNLTKRELIIFLPKIEKLDLFFILNSIGIVLTGPIIEEFVYRGIVFNYLKRHFNIRFAIIISSILFALIHFDFSGQIIVKFIYGLVFCISYQKTKSLTVPIILHIIINLFSRILIKQIIKVDLIILFLYIPSMIISICFLVTLTYKIYGNKIKEFKENTVRLKVKM